MLPLAPATNASKSELLAAWPDSVTSLSPSSKYPYVENVGSIRRAATTIPFRNIQASFRS
jgi:hypothetical protein